MEGGAGEAVSGHSYSLFPAMTHLLTKSFLLMTAGLFYYGLSCIVTEGVKDSYV